MPTLYCSFDPVVGWRVRLQTDESDARIQVVDMGFTKFLQIPSLNALRPGRFCNPAKVALAHTRQQRCAANQDSVQPNYGEVHHEC